MSTLYYVTVSVFEVVCLMRPNIIGKIAITNIKVVAILYK